MIHHLTTPVKVVMRCFLHLQSFPDQEHDTAVFELSPLSECSILSLVWFPGVEFYGSGNFVPNFYLFKYPCNLVPVILPAYTTYEDGTNSVFRNVGTQSSGDGGSPKRNNTI